MQFKENIHKKLTKKQITKSQQQKLHITKQQKLHITKQQKLHSIESRFYTTALFHGFT